MVVHNPPMTSINKCNGTEKEKETVLYKWFEDCRKIDKDISRQKHYPGWLESFFCMSFKHDGLALSLEYENGELTRAGLRSKSGKDGINVTEKTKYIKGIPQKLSLPITCIVRGEVETSISEFNRQCDLLGDEAKANPRAHTAGSMNQKTAEQMKDRGLQFVAYNIIGLKNPPYKTEIERAQWAEKELNLNFVKTIPFTQSMLETFEAQHRTLDFMVDGAVISVNELDLQAELGRTGDKETGNPKGKIAFKFKDEIKKTIVKDIVWQTGRTGNITPVLIIEPIQLEGTTVSKCTAHNLGIITSNKIGVGSEVEIIKSGKIIPKIKSVINGTGSPKIPTSCPACGGKVREVLGYGETLSLVCMGENCPAQNVKELNHFLKILGVKGISESTILKLIETGVLQKRSDFYSIWFDNLIKNGFSERIAILIDARIQMIKAPESIKDNKDLVSQIVEAHSKKKRIPMEKFIAAFGIGGAGKEVGRILTDEYGDFDKIRNLTIEELEQIDGIGPITAISLCEFFKENKNEIDALLKYFELEAPIIIDGKFSGKTFVLSGSLEGGKEYWKKEIEAKGGEIKGSVSKKIDYLVAGEGSGAKSEKALSLNIPILDTTALEEMLKG
jgi:DNA ligase (NAD+)